MESNVIPDAVPQPVLTRNALAMRDDRALCAMDVRLEYFEVQARTGRGRGRLPVVLVKQVESLNDDYRRYLGLTTHQGSAAFVGGGLARLRSGSSLVGVDGTERREILATLVTRAVDRATQQADRVYSPFLTATDLPAYRDAAPSTTVREHGVWCTLEIGQVAGVDDFFHRLPARRRRHWSRDTREAEHLGLSHDVVPFSDGIVAEAAAGIASVSRRNDMDESPDLVQWRINNFRRRPGDHFFVRTWWQGEPIAHMLCRMFDDTMDAHTLGIVDVPGLDRAAVYHFGCLLGPLRAAVERGAHRLELGIGHDSPKLRRGCTGEDTYFADLLPTA